MKIYVISINNYVDDLSLCFRYLSVDEKSEVLKFRFIADQCRKAVGILLSKFLIDGQRLEYADAIKRIEHGKPVSNINNKCFNISHAGTMVAGIVSNIGVGIDCEEQKAERFNIEIANKFFHISELEFLLLNDNFEEQMRKFYYIWTRKEAIIKGDGGGLTIPLNSFSVLTDDKIIVNNVSWFVSSLSDLNNSYYISYSSLALMPNCEIVRCTVSDFINAYKIVEVGKIL